MKNESRQLYARWARGPAFAAHGLIFALAFALFAFAQPLADDFCTAASGADLRDYLWQMYASWSGRWASLAIEHITLANFDPTRVYPFALGALAVGQLGCLYAFVRAFLGGRAPARLGAGLTASLFALYWSLHPSLGQTYYWFTGAVEYQLSFSMALLLVALLLSAPGASGGGLRWGLRAGAIVALALLLPGMHELLGLMLCVLLPLGALLSRRLGLGDRKLWALAAACSLAGFAWVAFTPGYAVRRASFPDSYNLPLALWLTPWQIVKASTRWVCDAKLLTATVLFATHPGVRALQPAWIGRAPRLWKPVTLGAWAALLAIGFGVPTFVTGQEIPNRVLGGVYLVFLLGWFVTVFVFTRGAGQGTAVPEPPRAVVSWALLLFALCLATTGNTRTAIYDLVHRAGPWSRALEQRYASLRKAAADHVPDVVVPHAPTRPGTFFHGPADITAQPTDWKNRCQANFFGVATLRSGESE